MQNQRNSLQPSDGKTGSALAGVEVVIHSNPQPRAGDSARPVTRQRHSRTDAEDSISAAPLQVTDSVGTSKQRDSFVTKAKGGKCRRN